MTRPKLLGPALEPTADPAWVMAEDGYDPLRESTHASRLSISNGLMGIRGGNAIDRGRRWVAPRHTIVAGLFDQPDGEASIPALVPAADWLQVRILLPCEAQIQHADEVVSHRVTLDLRRGALLTERRLLDPHGASGRMSTLRLVSLGHRAVGLQVIRLEIAAGEVEVTLEASCEGLDLGLTVERLEQALGVWCTRHSGKRLAMALDYFQQTAAIDLADTHVAIAGGVHIAALGGIWMMAVLGFAGLSLQADAIGLNPQLPAGWRRLGFRMQWRGRHLTIRIDGANHRLDAVLGAGEPMTMRVGGEPCEFRCSHPLRISTAVPT